MVKIHTFSVFSEPKKYPVPIYPQKGVFSELFRTLDFCQKWGLFGKYLLNVEVIRPARDHHPFTKYYSPEGATYILVQSFVCDAGGYKGVYPNFLPKKLDVFLFILSIDIYGGYMYNIHTQ